MAGGVWREPDVAGGGGVLYGRRGLGGAGSPAVGRGIGEGANIDWRGTTREMSKIKT